MSTYQQTMDAGSQGRRGTHHAYANIPPAPGDIGAHSSQGATPATAVRISDEAFANQINQFASLSLSSGNVPQVPATIHGLPHGAFVNGPEGSIVFATPFPAPLHPILADHAYGAAGYPIPYPPNAFAAQFGPGTMIPFAPGRALAYGDRLPRELPLLENRRSSYSTSATESAPATPFFGNVADRLNGGTRVASLERSSYTTPSPRDTVTYINSASHSKPMSDPDIERLLMQEPQIPKAVPAVWTDHIKPLEQCLENRIQGNRNVYIRGLHPTTDDELLLHYAERFGPVEQSKAIIDTATGACKGFGFAKFSDVRNSEKCIRGFYRLGYEVGFARESFNARLKAEGDEGSTNLYISNLPKDINESTLSQIFEPFHIVSSKILRDSMGNSRGVGFARFETRDVCERVIKNFHGITVGPEHFVMQVRYADTPSQKELKRVTAERRQYRTNEYNIGAYGTPAVGINPTIYAPTMWNRRGGAATSNSLRASSHSAIPSSFVRAKSFGPRGHTKAVTDADAVSSSDGSGDEGATIVEKPASVNNGSSKAPSLRSETASTKSAPYDLL